MGLLDSNKRIIKAEDSNFSTKENFNLNAAGYLCNDITVLPFAYCCLNVTLSDSTGKVYIYTSDGIQGDTMLNLVDIQGNIHQFITKSGNYYINVSGIKSFRPYSNKANSGSIIFSYTNSRPVAFDLRPVQTLAAVDTTLTDGQTSTYFQLKQQGDGYMYRYFKFFNVYVKSLNSGGTSKILASLLVKTSNISDLNVDYSDDYVTRAEATNNSRVSTGWLQVCSSNLFVRAEFPSATAGDRIYIEVRGIR